MKATFAFRLFHRVFVLGLCFLLLQTFTIEVALGSQAEDEDFALYLAQATFDPLVSIPAVPLELAPGDAEVAASGVYIVQFNGPVMDEWKQQVTDAGGIFGPYIPNYAFLVRLDEAALPGVQALPFVRWAGAYQPAYKLAASAVNPAQETRTYRVMLAPWADRASAIQAITPLADRPVQDLTQVNAAEQPDAAQPDTAQPDAAQPDAAQPDAAQPGASAEATQSLAADLTGDAVLQAARLSDVMWIEPVTLRKNFNDTGGGTIMRGSTAWANGYTGKGVAINVTDTGLDTGVAGTVHTDFRSRVAHISSWPVVYANYGGGCYPSNGGANDGADDVDSGHGTHVTGSVAGSGNRSAGKLKGLAYQATINMQAIEQWSVFPAFCGGSGYMLTGLPLDLAPLFQEAYNWGARVQNDSWGGGQPGVYDYFSFDFDDFINKHQDFTAAVAAGNAGTDGDGNGYVDQNSIASPGSAKNVITVGASENERATGGIADYTYGLAWPIDFPTAPTGTDRTSNSREHMAAFSSRGPMNDGRIKPDVVAPGTNILSVRSSLASGNGWGPYNQYYMYMGGTSMASPLTAGAAALVRQFYTDHEKVTNPSAALIKATLINTAVDIKGYGAASQEAGLPIPNNHEGWGRVDVGSATSAGRRFIDNQGGIATGATHTFQYYVVAGKPFKVTLAWSDPAAAPFASKTLVNNLNLRVTAPGGAAVYLGNRFSGGWSATGGTADSVNNVENVYIKAPVTGIWKVDVIGLNVPKGPQRFALVVSGDTRKPLANIKTSPASGTADQPLNLTLSWQASTGAATYEYCLNTSPSCPGDWTYTGAATSASVSGLAQGTTYYWQVRARNTAGVVDASGGWWNFTTVYTTPPTAFNKSGPGDGATGVWIFPNLTWSASSAVARYEYCLSTQPTCQNWVNAGRSVTVVPRLQKNTTYYWQVRAVNPIGTVNANGGVWSFTTTATVYNSILPSVIR